MAKLLDRMRTVMSRLFDPDPTPAQTSETLPVDRNALQHSWGRYVNERAKTEKTRFARYRDYDLMDEEITELSSGMDIYADNATCSDTEPYDSLAFESKDIKLVDFLTKGLTQCNYIDDLWPRVRDLGKYGDVFAELIFNNQGDLCRVKELDRFTTFRNEDRYGLLPKEKSFFQANSETETPSAEFEWFQVVHMRMRRSLATRYGHSILHSARRVFKQLQMMEDGVVITRLSRATQRYGITVDVGELQGEEAEAHVKRVRDQFKKRQFIDVATGKLTVTDNPLQQEDDIWIPSGPNGKSEVKVLAGQTNLDQMGDVEYFRNKLFACLKIPKAYLGLEEDTRSRSVITELDVQFARSTRRLQKGVLVGVRETTDRMMSMKGMDPETTEYKPLLPPISTVDELREWQIENLKATVAKLWGVDINAVSTHFLLQRFLDLTDEEIKQLEGEERHDAPQQQPDLSALFGGKGNGNAQNSNGGNGQNSLPPGAGIGKNGKPLPKGAVTGEEAFLAARLSNQVEALRDLVEMSLDGKRWGQAKDPVRNGRRSIVKPESSIK
jgi:hypothetical protein